MSSNKKQLTIKKKNSFYNKIQVKDRQGNIKYSVNRNRRKVKVKYNCSTFKRLFHEIMQDEKNKNRNICDPLPIAEISYILQNYEPRKTPAKKHLYVNCYISNGIILETKVKTCSKDKMNEKLKKYGKKTMYKAIPRDINDSEIYKKMILYTYETNKSNILKEIQKDTQKISSCYEQKMTFLVGKIIKNNIQMKYSNDILKSKSLFFVTNDIFNIITKNIKHN